MAHTLASIRDQVEINLADSSNLIWSTTILDEAIRAALLDISRIYDDVLTLNGLDGAGATTVEDLDAYVLVKGAAAHALVFRVVGRFEEATPEPNITPSLADLAEQRMKEFKSYLVQMDYLINGYVQDEAFYNWKTAENVLDRAHAVAEAALDRAARSDLQDDQFDWKTAEAVLDRAHAVSESALDRAAKADLQDDQFDWKSAEAILDRAHQVSEAALDRAAREDLQDDLLLWKGAEAVLDRAHAVAEAALDRAAKADLQDDQQTWQAAEAALDRAAKADLQDDQQTWSTAEKALDRAARAALDQAERDYKDAQLAAEEARLTELQESTDTPWSGWEWEEGSGFS